MEVTWDEYDDEDQNLVVFRLPGQSYTSIGNGHDNGDTEEEAVDEDVQDEDGNGDWVDEDEDERTSGGGAETPLDSTRRRLP